MKRLSIGAVASLFGIAVLVSAAMAARALSSDLVVQVLSVDQVGFNRESGPLFDQGKKVAGGMLWDTTTFVAKARILNVIRTDHDLTPGEIIDIKYNIRTTTPPLPSFPHDKPLTPGETVTLHVMGGNGKYERL